MAHNQLEKYNVPVPRYTSYPPANFFHSGVGEKEYLQAVDASNSEHPSLISFYLHMPYCHHLCHYCGCNSYLRPRQSDEETYYQALLKEIEWVTQRIDPSRKVAQIHFGGGSPSLVSPLWLGKIIEALTRRFSFISTPEIAIECHPGYLEREGYRQLLELGFNRMSLGIQDFDPRVLQAVHRTPPRLPIQEVQELLSAHGVPLNLDFIYGLPLQTVESFEATIRQAIALQPSRMVTFSYAHMPSLFPRQKHLERYGLPTAEEKAALYAHARQELTTSGYMQIGLDHFVLPTDRLYKAKEEHQLHRNFQGYCTRATTGQVYAFGVSAISQLTSAYAQNSKDIPTYIKSIDQGHLPIARGYLLTPREQITREVITTLMCNERVEWAALEEQLKTPKAEILQAIGYDPTRMKAMEEDGLIVLSTDGLRMVHAGSPFLRYVAATLDPLQQGEHGIYSQPV